MNRNRLIQLASLLGLAMCLAAAALLSGPIHRQRQELKLTYNPTTREAIPWEIAVTQAALGSFRGLAVDFMWYRANQLKDQGQYREADQLSRWICLLQPRFQKVWAFHAWNMAYNISVATHTPEERWEWVNKGIRLLRDEGIRANPNSVLIRKELGWIFGHKIGAMSDDMHWYYRRKLAEEWQEVLGSPEGLNTDQVLRAMADIVEAPDSLDTLRLDAAVDRTLQKLQALGYAPDGALLRQIGRLHMFNSSADRRLLVLDPEMVSRFIDTRLYQLCFDEAVAPAYAQGFGKLVPFLRRKVLVDEYNMDPAEMLRMMQTYGPLDWRHPAAHSAYWSEQGVRAAVATLNKKDIDQLNTDRQIIHAMQALAGSGRLTFDPITGDLDMLPDPRFIKAYETAYDDARARVESEQWRGTKDSYDAGYENFLLEAMRYSYVYGDEEQARGYFERWREKFREQRENEEVWRMSLPELVLRELRETNELFEDRRQLIDAMLRRAFFEGMANDRRDVFARYVTLAAEAHRLHQASKPVNPDAPQDRMKFPPFNEVLLNTYVQLMRDPRVPLIRRGRIWLRSDIRLRQLAYDQVREAVRAQAEQTQLDPDRLLPEPPDMDQHRRAAAAPPAPAEGESTREPPKTIERK